MKPSHPFSLFSRLRRDRRGTSAVEFAVLATPFLVLFLGFFEVMFIFLNQANLEEAITEGARRLRTGQVTANPDPDQFASNFKNSVCSSNASIACASLRVDLDVISGFGDTNTSTDSDTDSDTGFVDEGSFLAPEGQDIIFLRFYYYSGFLTPLSGAFFANNSSTPNQRLYRATRLFNAEPF